MPSKEYYRKLKKEAHDLYVNDGLTCREISERVNVSEKSVSAWINANDGLWKKERQSAAISVKQQGDNLKEIIKMLADDKLEILRQIDEATKEGDKERELELRKQASSVLSSGLIRFLVVRARATFSRYAFSADLSSAVAILS